MADDAEIISLWIVVIDSLAASMEISRREAAELIMAEIRRQADAILVQVPSPEQSGIDST